MALTKRERLIAGVLGAALALYVGDYYVIEPFFSQRQITQRELEQASRKLQAAQGLVENRKRINDQWRVVLNNGLKDNASDAESVALHAVTDWATVEGVRIESHKTDTPTTIKDARNLPTDFQQMRVNFTATGSSASIAHLVADVETSRLPLQLGDIRIASRKDGTDELTLQLTVNTLIFAPQQPATKPSARRTTNGEA